MALTQKTTNTVAKFSASDVHIKQETTQIGDMLHQSKEMTPCKHLLEKASQASVLQESVLGKLLPCELVPRFGGNTLGKGLSWLGHAFLVVDDDDTFCCVSLVATSIRH